MFHSHIARFGTNSGKVAGVALYVPIAVPRVLRLTLRANPEGGFRLARG